MAVNCRSALARLVFLLGGLILVTLSAAAENFGSFGPEGSRMREQLWVVPGADPNIPLRATLFRPSNPSAKRLPLDIINHGTDDRTRLSVSMPVYYWLSFWFVERGYAVLLPQRRGHGATGGPLAEAAGNCAAPDHYRSGLAAAKDIASAISFMKAQSFIDPENITAVGVSSGGWASLALAAHMRDEIRAVINFAGGRGGHAFGKRGRVCGEKNLLSAAAAFGATASARTIWFYARNDSYFPPQLAKSLASAWEHAGGDVELNILPPLGRDGYHLAASRTGWDLWGSTLDNFLHSLPPRTNDCLEDNQNAARQVSALNTKVREAQ